MQRKEHWEKVYGEKAPDSVSWYQAEPTLSLLMMERSGVGPGQPVIDVGGGTSLLVDNLAQRGFADVTVLDISSHALEKVRERIGEPAGTVELIESDLLDFEPTRSYALWHDRAVLHFLTRPDEQARYAQVLRAALAPGGTVIVATFAVGGPKRCSGCETVQYDAHRLSRMLGSDFELLEEVFESHRTPAGGEQAFAWFRLHRIA